MLRDPKINKTGIMKPAATKLSKSDLIVEYILCNHEVRIIPFMISFFPRQNYNFDVL